MSTGFNIFIRSQANLTGVQQAVTGINQVGAATVATAKKMEAASSGILSAGKSIGDVVVHALGVPLSIGAAAASIVHMFSAAKEAAVELKHISEQLEITTTESQQLQKAARATGLDIYNFATALLQVGVARRAAAEGDEELRKKFARFGVTLRDMNDPALRNIDLIKQMGRAMGDLTAADRTSLRDLLGRRGEALAAAIAGIDRIKEVNLVNPESIDRIEAAEKRAKSYFGFWKTQFMEIAGFYADLFEKAHSPPLPEQYQPNGTLAMSDVEIQNLGARAGAEHLRQIAEMNRGERKQGEFTGIAKLDRQYMEASAVNPELTFEKFFRELMDQRVANNKTSGDALFDDKKQKEEQRKAGELALENARKEEELALSLMSVEQRRNALIEKRALLLGEIDELDEKSIERQQKITEEIALRKQLAELDRAKPGIHAPGPADSLQRIGGYLGPVVGDNRPTLDQIKQAINQLGGKMDGVRTTIQSGVKVEVVR